MPTVTVPVPARTLGNSSLSRQSYADTSALVSAADVGVADRVLIIGRNVIEQVVALVQAGCHTVSSLCADLSYPRHEPVDILWLAKIGNIQDRLDAALALPAIPRIVVVEISSAEGHGRLRAIARQLRTRGFARFKLHRIGQGAALVAARPTWLQQVI